MKNILFCSDSEKEKQEKLFFASKFISNKKTRIILSNFLYENENLIASDSFRLVLIKNIYLEIEDGLYNVYTVKKRMIILKEEIFYSVNQFPKYKKIIPKGKPKKTKTINFSQKTAFSKLIKITDKENGVDLDLIKDLKGYWKVNIYNQNQPIEFTQDNIFVYVMPLLIRED